jgi:hypothetical protein
MSNRKQSSASKPLFVKDRIDLAHRMQTSEGKPWGEYLDQAPVIHGGPMVTELSLNLLGSMRVQNWETYNHAKSRGVTVDRASGVEVMGIKQPADALWGFTVYPVAVTKPAPQKPASAKPKPIARAPIAKPKPVRAPVAIKRKAKLGKMTSYEAEYSAGLARASRGVFPDMTGFISEKERLMSARVPCSLAAMGITRERQAEVYNDHVRNNPQCKLKEITEDDLVKAVLAA